MCTTNLCLAFYVLTFCVVGWIGALSLIMIKSTKEQGSSYVFDPLACWINSELVSPLNCFRSEIVKPLVIELAVLVKEWNKVVGSNPELKF